MKEYNKEKLHEYAKELALLCIDKNITFEFDSHFYRVYVFFGNKEQFKISFLSEHKYNENDELRRVIPIWELIEKVKQL